MELIYDFVILLGAIAAIFTALQVKMPSFINVKEHRESWDARSITFSIVTSLLGCKVTSVWIDNLLIREAPEAGYWLEGAEHYPYIMTDFETAPGHQELSLTLSLRFEEPGVWPLQSELNASIRWFWFSWRIHKSLTWRDNL